VRGGRASAGRHRPGDPCGKLSFAFLEAWPFQRWGASVGRTHQEVADELDLSVEITQRIVEAFGFSRPQPEDPVTDGELDTIRLLARALDAGVIDVATTVRFGAVYADTMRRAAAMENEVYHSGFEMPLLRTGHAQPQTLQLAAEASGEFTEPLERTLVAVYRRQQEVTWTEHLIEHIESALEESGLYRRPTGRRRCASWISRDTRGSPRNGGTRRRPGWRRRSGTWSSGSRAGTTGKR
jgi:hypothetical protein